MIDASKEVHVTPDITIFVSCYNERDSIIPTIETVTRALSRLPTSSEILVIDDCSTDDSATVVETLILSQPVIPVRLVRHDINRGLGYSIFEAARLARGKYFWYVAGDNPVPEDTCAILFARVGKADIIIPHVVRYMGRSMFRRVVSRLYGVLVRFASGSKVHYFNGSAIYLREQFLKHDDIPPGFGYSAEVIVALLNDGCSYLEVPVLYNERKSGKSTALSMRNFRDVLATLGRLLSRRLGMSTAKISDQSLLSDRS